jgi:hypothetical protein
MKNNNIYFLLIAFGISCCLAGCTSKVDVDLGGVDVSVPTPSGYYPVAESAPNFIKFISKGLSDKTKVIDYFLTKKDYDDVLAGHSKFRKKSLMISMPDVLYGQSFSASDFSKFVEKKKRIDTESIKSEETTQNERNEINAFNSGFAPVLSSDSTWLGIIIDKDNIIGDAYEQITHENTVPVKRVSASVEIHLKDRLMSIDCSSIVENDEDINSVEDGCKKWGMDILEKNQR